MNVLVGLCCSWLKIAIVRFLSFRPFAAVADESLCIVDELDVVMCKVFL